MQFGGDPLERHRETSGVSPKERIISDRAEGGPPDTRSVSFHLSQFDKHLVRNYVIDPLPPASVVLNQPPNRRASPFF